MLEALFWMAVGAALMHFFPDILVGVYRAGKAFARKVFKRG